MRYLQYCTMSQVEYLVDEGPAGDRVSLVQGGRVLQQVDLGPELGTEEADL